MNQLGLEVQQEEQRMIDEAKPLTEEEEAEKRILLSQGFSSWNTLAFTQLINANLQFGRLDIAAISNRVKGILFKHDSTLSTNCKLFIFISRKNPE